MCVNPSLSVHRVTVQFHEVLTVFLFNQNLSFASRRADRAYLVCMYSKRYELQLGRNEPPRPTPGLWPQRSQSTLWHCSWPQQRGAKPRGAGDTITKVKCNRKICKCPFKTAGNK